MKEYVPGTVGVPIRGPAVWPWKYGPLNPVGMWPPSSVHCTGPLVVSQPVVVKSKVVGAPAARVPAGCGSMTQLPVGGGVLLGGVAAVGVPPARVTVAIGVRRSETTTLQSSERKLVAWTR